ncbi:hypothetical protein QQS21_004621 [Conoideocrella luteorostrata]|uniref:Uncharacterized protein n=1 Tax=Conoideocrella luteorostrata TaxID=1105319 RepID=A0AAJ0CV64_9HYPO|nr:hypothetical protein QQS21_004621 [Conoideocrella luteorostrata]
MSTSNDPANITAAKAALALLRISPVAISSASLMFSWAQDLFFSAFIHPNLAQVPNNPAGKLMPHYMPTIWTRGTPAILISYPGVFALAMANGYGAAKCSSLLAARLYLAGGLFSISHFYYGLRSKALTSAIGDPSDPGAKNENSIKAWLAMNFKRSLLVNVPAWLCLVAATVVAVLEGI